MEARRNYLIGFGLSVGLTLIAFWVVAVSDAPYWFIVLFICTLAVIQLFVQLYYFLHLADEKKPRWRLQTFVAAAVVVLIVVFGSIWIMTNLSKYHGHNILNEDIGEHIEDEEAIQKDQH